MGIFRIGLGAILSRSYVKENHRTPEFSDLTMIPFAILAIEYGGYRNTRLGNYIALAPAPSLGCMLAYHF